MRTINLVVFLLLNALQKCASVCSNVYGAEPCRYIPALPGQTPPCARPGLTYCEHPSEYPGQLIQHLIEKWRYDHSTLLSNETPDDFHAYYPPTDTKYGPPTKSYSYEPQNSLNSGYPGEPIYIPKPTTYQNFNPIGNMYIPPTQQRQHNFTDGFLGYPDRRYQLFQVQEQPSNQLLKYKAYKTSPQPNTYNNLNVYTTIGQPEIMQYNPDGWWKRYRRRAETKQQSEIQLRRKRSLNIHKNMRSISGNFSSNVTAAPHLRSKRQSASLIGESLCTTRTQYVMPRAALNNKGNWMFVVNMPELDSRYTQLVKSETCISQQCSGLCGLPSGYTSRCEQKYVQKRLVALEGAGTELYTDVFWFPSCCVCTVSNN